MKGIILTVLSDLVQEKYGLRTWDELIQKVNPKSGGSYTAAQSYDDIEVFQLIDEISKKINKSVPNVIRSFGEYMLLKMSKRYPDMFTGKDIKEFLLSIDQVIHREVLKLYPDAQLPKFKYEDQKGQSLVMLYFSKRKLCTLAEGLISGAAIYYQVELVIKHSKCIHKGDDHCRFEMKWENKK